MHREFDFWLGRWRVEIADGRHAGDNHIERQIAGCVLVERWSSVNGGGGASFNFVDPGSGQWRQFWVSPGLTIDIEGGLQDESMVMTGKIRYHNQPHDFDFRGTWTPMADGRVRQYFEEAREPGTWQPWFEGFYTRTE